MSQKQTRSVQDYFDLIAAVQYTDHQKELKLSRNLLTLARKQQNSYATAFAYLHLCHALFSQGSLRAALSYAWKGMQLQEQEHYDDLLMLQYGYTAVILSKQGDEQYALKYFFESLQIAKQRHDYMHIGLTTNNIGTLFSDLKDYDTAIEYFKSGYSYSRLAKKQKADRIYPIEVFYINLATVYCYKGNVRTALHYLDKCCRLLTPERYKAYELNIETIRAQIALRQGDSEAACRSALTASRLCLASSYIQELFPAYIELAELFLQLEKYDDVKIMLDQCRSLMEREQLPERRLQFYGVCIRYCKAVGEDEELARCYRAHYEWQERQNAILDSMRVSSIKMRLKLQKLNEMQASIEEENAVLRSLSQEDELTGAYNRHGLNTLIDSVYRRAQNEQQSFGLILIDCDYFKEYNDIYGHVAGDRCLHDIAAVLSEAAQDRGYVVRYGGDEFCLLFRGLPDELFRQIAETICERMRSLAIPHVGSAVADHVTVSAGGINCIPSPTAQFFDYLHAADSALYRTKHLGRDGFSLSSSL
ncbi:MAG: diguanylate cyclase [Lachnospiraceae bacterium]|nr:diguanylate cyclase [Lachnospiraceae bacterium]